MRAGWVLALALAAAGATMGQAAEVTGSAGYRERMAPPPGAVLEVDLLDVSLADAPALRLGRTRVAVERVPVDFAVAYDPAAIDPRNSYSLAARLTVGGQVLFRTDTASPVLTRGAGSTAELMLVRTDEPAPSAADLAGGWIVTEIAGAPSADGVVTTIDFAEGRATGDGGCNRFNGGYEAEGERLAFGQVMSTMRACPDPAMAQEAAFFKVLEQTSGFRFEGSGVLLLDADGTVLARLERGA